MPCVNRFLTIGWRDQAQFCTLTYLVFRGPPTVRITLEGAWWSLGPQDGVAVVSQTLSVRSRIFVAALAASVISGLPAVAAGSGYPASGLRRHAATNRMDIVL